MALPFKKDLGKYKDIDEDEILGKLSAEDLKQLEMALEEMDPEVSEASANPLGCEDLGIGQVFMM